MQHHLLHCDVTAILLKQRTCGMYTEEDTPYST